MNGGYMEIEYTEVGETTSERKQVKVDITIDHPASSYGQPVILMRGIVFDHLNWIFTGAIPIKMSKKEFKLYEKWTELLQISYEVI